jgi:hypothetical protein
MDHPSDASAKEEQAAKSRDDLIHLLLKLNDLLKEKLGLSKKREPAPRQADVMIIIMTRQKEKKPSGKSPKPVQTAPSQGDWMGDLFAEIEGIPIRRRKTS